MMRDGRREGGRRCFNNYMKILFLVVFFALLAVFTYFFFSFLSFG